jgi:recombination protein RecT
MADLATKQQDGVKAFFAREDVRFKFQEMLGKRAPQFITSVLQIASSNSLLKNAEPISIYNAAAVAATLDLPLNNSLGFAWIVPFAGKAQFQIGWKGLVQLAQRTGQYKRINVVEVYKNQFKAWNSLTEELDADFSIEGVGDIVGYCAYFQLLNGFEKVVYWSREKVLAHGKRYSKTFTNGPWKTDTDAMCKKTVLKNALSQWGILSIEMQQAFKVDQGVVTNAETMDVEYTDATEPVNKEEERLTALIEGAKSMEDLAKLEEHISTPEQKDLFSQKVEEVKANGSRK